MVSPEQRIQPDCSTTDVEFYADDTRTHTVRGEVSFTDIFGNLSSRCAFNQLVTNALLGDFVTNWLCPLLAADEQRCRGEFTFIVHGGRLNNSAMRVPREVVIRDAVLHSIGDYVPPPHALPLCNQVESDIMVGWYSLAVFRDEPTIVHSCDMDIQLVVGFAVETQARNTRRLQDVPARLIHKCYNLKDVGMVRLVIDMREQYACIRNVFTTYCPSEGRGDPMVLYALLVTSAGNDFMRQAAATDPRPKKPANGIRMTYVFAAYFQHYREIGAIVQAGPPTSRSARWPAAWPVRIVYAGWRKLMGYAAALMDQSGVRASYDAAKLQSEDHMRAHCARVAWSINYYRNAQHPGYIQPDAAACDTQHNLSLYGYQQNEETGLCEYAECVRRQRVYCGALYSEEAPDQEQYCHVAKLEGAALRAAMLRNYDDDNIMQ
jgi:hypothetical protein